MSLGKYNINDAFIHKYKKFILAFTYTPGFDIDYIINDLTQTFGFKIFKLEGPNMLKSDSIFNYTKLNNEVNKLLEEFETNTNANMPVHKQSNILIYGFCR